LSCTHWAVLGSVLLTAACQRQHPEDAPSSKSVGLVPAAPKALGARAATLEPLPLPEPETTPDPSGDETEEPPELELGGSEADGGVPL
jgi:hypothetical protein